MSSLMMALVRQNMWERLTRHHNKAAILLHLLVFYKDILFCTFKFLCIFETLPDRKNFVCMSEFRIKCSAKFTY
jgi:hypothetical protein